MATMSSAHTLEAEPIAAPSPSALLHLLTLKYLSDSGFASTSSAASLTLSSVLERYLLTTARGAISRAEHAGRGKAGALDVVHVLEEIHGKGAIDELEQWAGREKREGWAGEVWESGVKAMRGQVDSGRGINQALAALSVVPSGEIPLEMEEEEEEEEDVDMDVDVDTKDGATLPPIVRASTPDMSWLPGLPGQGSKPVSSLSRSPSLASDQGEVEPPESVVIPTKEDAVKPPEPTPDTTIKTKEVTSLAHRLSTIIPFTSSPSDLVHFFPGTDPAFTDKAPATTVHRPRQPRTRKSTLPALMAAYEALSREGTTFFQSTPMRMQAHDLLSRVIAPADFDMPEDTLSYHLSGPRVSYAQPSYSEKSEEGALPIPAVALNPNPTGVLARLVREMRSPYLSPALRKELLHLSPPPPQMQIQPGETKETPVLYNEPVRGPDRAALATAHGKVPPTDAGAERFYRYTFDAGPRGEEKWARKIQMGGKKVVQSGIGEDAPRKGRFYPNPKGDEKGLNTDMGKAGEGEDSGAVVMQNIAAGIDVDMEGGQVGAGPGDTLQSVPLQIGGQAGSQAPAQSITPTEPSRPRISLGPPKLRLSTASVSPSVPNTTIADMDAPQQQQQEQAASSSSISLAPVSTESNTGAASGGLKIRFGAAPKRPSVDRGDSGSGVGSVNTQEKEGDVPKRPAFKIRLSNSGHGHE